MVGAPWFFVVVIGGGYYHPRHHHWWSFIDLAGWGLGGEGDQFGYSTPSSVVTKTHINNTDLDSNWWHFRRRATAFFDGVANGRDTWQDEPPKGTPTEWEQVVERYTG